MKLSEKWKRWLRRLDLAVMVWWAAYMSIRMCSPRNYPYMKRPDAIVFFSMFFASMLVGWLKVYEPTEEEPEEEMRWLVRIRTWLLMCPMVVALIYELYLLYPKLSGLIWRWPTI